MKLNEIFTNKEQKFLKKELPRFSMDTDYDDEKLIEFEEALQDLSISKGFDEDYNINDFGKETERLIDKFFDKTN